MKVVSSHNYCLDTLSEIHDVFHTNLLHSAISDSFLSQKIDNYQSLDYNQSTWELVSTLENTTTLDIYDQSLSSMNISVLE
ncbi:hypothetical protein ACJ72_08727 [Emergomyces africanus]|uniref:Uncharacterized protein n=1 Tax=Emergomyces africanus TaxID=1955775 RepID=A0A1B7NJD1_9EURO|nr:hypothetical protein ACJ72_08727 [Emergomyces africanus]